MISTLKLALGDLDRIKRIVKINGVVNSTLDFTQQADVMNGCSDLFGEIFGTEVGSHARCEL
jgi:enamine deaminase RidA (YjgF/YER057c/UK114 family)